MDQILSMSLTKGLIVMKKMIMTILVIFLIIPATVSAFSGTLKRIEETGIMRIGYRSFQPPMSSLAKNGVPEGYSIDLCNHIAKGVQNAVGREIDVQYVQVSAENRFNTLSQNEIDILCGSTTLTLSRREIVDFTLLTFVTGGSYLTMKGVKIENNFDGKRFGVVKGTTTATALAALFEDVGVSAEIIMIDSTEAGLDALENKEIDAFCADQVVLIGLVLQSSDPQRYSVLPGLFSYEPFALAVRKNDADFRLVADKVISGLYRSNEIEQIYTRWFGKFSNIKPSAFEAMVQLNSIPE